MSYILNELTSVARLIKKSCPRFTRNRNLCRRPLNTVRKVDLPRY